MYNSPSRHRSSEFMMQGMKLLEAFNIQNDWEKRIAAMKSLELLLASQERNSETLEFFHHLREPLKANVLDRSVSSSSLCLSLSSSYTLGECQIKQSLKLHDPCHAIKHLDCLEIKAITVLKLYKQHK